MNNSVTPPHCVQLIPTKWWSFLPLNSPATFTLSWAVSPGLTSTSWTGMTKDGGTPSSSNSSMPSKSRLTSKSRLWGPSTMARLSTETMEISSTSKCHKYKKENEINIGNLHWEYHFPLYQADGKIITNSYNEKIRGPNSPRWFISSTWTIFSS